MFKSTDGKRFVARNSEEAVALLYGAIFTCVLAKVMNVDWTNFEFLGLRLNPDERLFETLLNSLLMFFYASFSLHLHSEIASDKFSILHNSARHLNDFIETTARGESSGLSTNGSLKRFMWEMPNNFDVKNDEIVDIFVERFYEKIPEFMNRDRFEGTHFNKRSGRSVLMIQFFMPTAAFIFAICA
ncbi:hypothetical protein SAMN06273572_102300 [Monaibacterium marinum]|uniref:Uncharacterized protein n=1 Tax=Pontivivens marinum TaxID=1690039 RepID=A0A2C9CQY2_9RHOB|nr:hypothetical protein [Monaibacterium marinum]SOH93623.1 hypothetical protein SAMN06273572_102300 [Monaibacterium marinum]